MTEFVLDASALLAMLNDEPGGAKVADNIASARIGVINYGEVVSHFVRLGMPERDIDAMLDPLPMEVVPADKGLGKMAGRLRGVTAQAGLSLGDRFCLALALRDGLPAWTANKAWKTVEKDVGVDVVTIR
ncbi:type II toxin-antitoxin system VapC family toxin [Novosphingobium sp. G106]|uniref:type II toxin-antitoxin system VapC family toxin n=1 Tax=Novosphingobium sp. G106 TaxID=2849500 RepID=UPI001C2CFC45|nr:type II toxin-antitoxin system VapC family toxin [Novosphingobium sp. G106]MBV1692690.1 type II toxin-antitoxin system VapC family toxin [Novosphingobium sp. G106]